MFFLGRKGVEKAEETVYAGVDHSSITVSFVSTKNSTISSSKSWTFEESESVSNPLRAATRQAWAGKKKRKMT